MTNQEAINYLLDPLSLPHDMDIMDKLNWHEDAVNMAIEALKAQELKNVPDTNVGSMISRQAAIDALMEILDRPHHAEFLYTDEICRALNGLPSVQPDIIACGDCKHYIPHDKRCGYWNHGVKPLEWCCHAERKENQ